MERAQAAMEPPIRLNLDSSRPKVVSAYNVEVPPAADYITANRPTLDGASADAPVSISNGALPSPLGGSLTAARDSLRTCV